MKSFDVVKDIERIKQYFELNDEELACKVSISRANLIRYQNGTLIPSFCSLENIYSFSYTSGLDLNLIKSRFLQENRNGNILLFHGARNVIEGEIDNAHSIKPNDFGSGFYLGTNLTQAAMWICLSSSGCVYPFYFENKDNLKYKEFSSSREWLYAVLYYRGAFEGKQIPKQVLDIVNEIEKLDYIIAPIADNRVYELINSFIKGEITDEACLHAISLTDLGKQYVLKSNDAIKSLNNIECLYLPKEEKNYYLKVKNAQVEEYTKQVKMALLEYRRKGKYIDELF